MAAQLEETLREESTLVQSSGGVFEIEDRGVLIFSKKKENRFPDEGEIIALVNAVASGSSLAAAQTTASAEVKKPPSFFNWFAGKFKQS